MQQVNILPNEELRKKNFDAFERRYGVRPVVDPEENSKFRMGESKTGEAVLYVTGGMGNGGLRLTSSYSPSYEAGRWAEKQEGIGRRTTIALLGFSTGVYLRALISKLRPDTMYFVYEPEESLFSFVCAYMDNTDLIECKNICFFVSKEQHSRYSEKLLLDLSGSKSEAVGITTPFYSENEDFINACESIRIVMESQNNYQRERGRDALKARLYSWNHLRNSYLIADFEKSIPEDVPAIIVAAGPSLLKNVEELKNAKGHAFIIATDRAVGTLDEHGIVPDAVISVDAQKDPEYMDYSVTRNIPLIASYQVNPEAQKLFDGRVIFFHGLIYETGIVGERLGNWEDTLDLGGNVAGAAFALCRSMGIKTIILIGQDLAKQGDKHHADGRDEGVGEVQDRIIEGIDGRQVVSNDMWISFRDFYERQIRMYPGIRVIDATEGGALIHGSEVMTLKEACADTCKGTFDIDKVVHEMPKAQNQEEYEKSVDMLEVWTKVLDMFCKNADELVILCNQLLKVCRYQDIRDPKYKKKIARIDDLRAEIIISVVNSLMEEFWITDMYSIPDQTFMLRNNEEAIPVFESAISYYEHFPESCRSLKAAIKKAIEEGRRDGSL